MEDREIIGRLARERRVEKIVRACCPGVTGADYHDLCQIVYVALLTKPDGRVSEALEGGWLDYLIAAIARRQAHGNRTEFRALHLKMDENENTKD